jgi:hypothetical protein
MDFRSIAKLGRFKDIVMTLLKYGVVLEIPWRISQTGWHSASLSLP